MTRDFISPRAVPGDKGRRHAVTGLEHDENGRPNDHAHEAMSAKRHEKLNSVVRHPGITMSKRFGDKGKVDVAIIGWGSTFGEILEAMIIARDEGIRCAAMKVVLLSPLPMEPINALLADAPEVLVPELNFEGQFANLLTGTTGRAVTRLNRVPGTPMHVEDIVDEIRRLAAKRKGRKRIAAE